MVSFIPLLFVLIYFQSYFHAPKSTNPTYKSMIYTSLKKNWRNHHILQKQINVQFIIAVDLLIGDLLNQISYGKFIWQRTVAFDPLLWGLSDKNNRHSNVCRPHYRPQHCLSTIYCRQWFTQVPSSLPVWCPQCWRTVVDARRHNLGEWRLLCRLIYIFVLTIMTFQELCAVGSPVHVALKVAVSTENIETSAADRFRPYPDCCCCYCIQIWSLNHHIHANKRANTRNRDTTCKQDEWLSYVASRIGSLATNIVQWQPLDVSRLTSGFLVGTDAINLFLITRAGENTMLPYAV